MNCYKKRAILKHMLALSDYLQSMVKVDASDLYLSTNAFPSVKVHGRLLPLEKMEQLAPGEVATLAYSVMRPDQQKEFSQKLELNLALSQPGLGRFRVNVFRQRNEVSMVVRLINTQIPDFATLGLPPILEQLALEKRGLILFVGATSSGKTTSLASVIDYRNSHAAGHIITIEDPIEFVHKHKLSIVNQREVGIDTLSYDEALKNTLRQAPDVILIGEIRSRETMQQAIIFAETGHLCLSSLHASNANQAFERIVNFFPPDQHTQLLLDLSLHMVAIISQRLVPSLDGKRVLAAEILLASPLIKDLIKKSEIDSIKAVMEKSENQGMQTFDNALFQLYKAGKISEEEALQQADSRNNLRVRIAMDKGPGEQPPASLSLQDK